MSDENDNETYEQDIDNNKKSTKPKNKQRREMKQIVHTFVKNDSDLPLEWLTLYSFKQTTRYNTIFDVSDTVLVLDDNTEKVPLETSPSEIMSKLLNLCCKCYWPADLERSMKERVRTYFEKYMRKFPSYFIMDFVYDKISSIKVYEVIATVLFEASVF